MGSCVLTHSISGDVGCHKTMAILNWEQRGSKIRHYPQKIVLFGKKIIFFCLDALFPLIDIAAIHLLPLLSSLILWSFHFFQNIVIATPLFHRLFAQSSFFIFLTSIDAHLLYSTAHPFPPHSSLIFSTFFTTA